MGTTIAKLHITGVIMLATTACAQAGGFAIKGSCCRPSRTGLRKPLAAPTGRGGFTPARAVSDGDKGGSTKGDFGSNVARIARQVRDSLPIVGLISRLTIPEGIGGKDIQTYPEFCRFYIKNPPPGFSEAMVKLQGTATTETADRRFVMICLWMCKFGAGIIKDSQLAKAGLRLPITRDIEAEMDRFDMDRASIVSKYPLMEPPQPDPVKGVALAVDSLSMCLYSAKQTDGLPDGAGESITTVVSAVFPEVDAEVVKEAVLTRPTRSYQ